MVIGSGVGTMMRTAALFAGKKLQVGAGRSGDDMSSHAWRRASETALFRLAISTELQHLNRSSELQHRRMRMRRWQQCTL